MKENVFSDLSLDVFKITKQPFLMRRSEQYILGFFSLVVVLIGLVSSGVDTNHLYGIYLQDLFYKYGSMIGTVYMVMGVASFILTTTSFISYYLTTPIPLFLFFYNQYRMCVVLDYPQYMFGMFLSLALFLASAYFAGTLICNKR